MRWLAPSRPAATAGTDQRGARANRRSDRTRLHDDDPDLDQPGAMLAPVKHKPATPLAAVRPCLTALRATPARCSGRDEKTRMLDDKASKMRPNNCRWWQLTIIWRPLAQARSGPREQVFMITGFGVHERTD